MRFNCLVLQVTEEAMFSLREPIGANTHASDYSATYAALLDRLRQNKLEILREDEPTGEVVVRCLCNLSLFLWQCWSDELLFVVRRTGKGGTRIEAFALPNLFRLRPGKSEQVVDASALVRRLL